MLSRFETKSNRVKGLSFHPQRPWLLASLHTGSIQLWDYRMKTLIDTFDEHTAPVRGVSFHLIQPLFVSGSDDFKVKVWNYKTKKCLFTLLGHVDYVRSVKFHNEYPWILSSSDDQTIRIWNWQSRDCISVLTGHSHYVMYADFHPTKDLILSTSLDTTIRVWDISALRKKRVNGTPNDDQNSSSISRLNSDLFGVTKFVLEGHDRCVNWASFHPTLNLIVSGSDDHQIKIWRYNDSRAWEVDTLRGHTGNVSSVLFHPTKNLIISCSEDHSIRIWDATKRICINKFPRAHDRYWVLSIHPSQDLISAGHDSGLIVFKLNRERPAYTSYQNELYYVKDKYIRLYDFTTTKDTPISSISNNLSIQPKTLIYNSMNPNETDIILFSNSEGGSYEIYKTGKGENSSSSESVHGNGLSVIFTARNRIAVLEKDHKISIRGLDNQLTKPVTPPVGNWSDIFSGGIIGRIILRSEDRILLFDTTSRKQLGIAMIGGVKYVQWNENNEYIALMCKEKIWICNKELDILCSSEEAMGVKGGAWDKRGAFVFSTLNHIKYITPSGDCGVIRTIDFPCYTTKVENNYVYVLDREYKPRRLLIDATEYLFKINLESRNINEVIKIIKSGRLCGEAIIEYLHKKGYPEVALNFVNDPSSRFELALKCGNVEVAAECAITLNKEECYKKLADIALERGKISVAEMAYQKTKSFEKLSYLYLITGNTEKLRKMLKIAEMRQNIMSRYLNALLLGDPKERVKILSDAGENSLAYLTALTYHIDDEIPNLKSILDGLKIEIPENINESEELYPPKPIELINEYQIDENKLSYFDGINNEESSEEEEENENDNDNKNLENIEEEKHDNNAWGNEELDIPSEELISSEKEDKNNNDELEIESENIISGNKLASSCDYWIENYSLAGIHIASGSIESAMRLLNRQIGVINFEPLKEIFKFVYLGSKIETPGYSICPPLLFELIHDSNKITNIKKTIPPISIKFSHLTELLKEGYKCFQLGKFNDSLNTFQKILYNIPVIVVNHKSEVDEVKELVNVSRNYITACRIELQRRKESNPLRQLELSCYMSHCNLQPNHMLLVLNLAMTNAFKLKNYINSADFARRILEIKEVDNKLKERTLKVLQVSEKQARNENTINYNPQNQLLLSSNDFIPLNRGDEILKCPYCNSCIFYFILFRLWN